MAAPVILPVLRHTLGADIDKDAIENKVREIQEPETRVEVMTLAQQYHNERRQEGSLNHQREDVIEALEIRFERVSEGLAEAVSAFRTGSTCAGRTSRPSSAPR